MVWTYLIPATPVFELIQQTLLYPPNTLQLFKREQKLIQNHYSSSKPAKRNKRLVLSVVIMLTRWFKLNLAHSRTLQRLCLQNVQIPMGMICLEIVILFIYLFTYLVTFFALLIDCRVTVLQNKLLVIGMYKTPTFIHFTTKICLKSWRFDR